MIRPATVILTAVLAAALVACSDENKPAAQAPTPASHAADGYPIDYCIVSGEKLGSMGDPVVITIEGKKVKLCCDGCADSLRKEPAKYLAKLAAATPAKSPAASH